MGHQKKFHSFSDLEKLQESQNPEPDILRKESRSHDGNSSTVRLILDTHGRKGKRVTLVTGLHHNPATMEELARILKHYCGSGGTLKNGVIELQGDQRVRAAVILKELNYIVK